MNRTSSIQKTRMQALAALLPQTFPDSKEFTPISAKPDQDANSKLKLDEDEENFEEQEFSFACANPRGSLIFADEIFDNGHIRPLFPIFDQSVLFVDTQNKETSSLRPPLKKLFVEQRNCNSSNLDGQTEEPYCKWEEKMTILEVETSNVSCKKSSSTGFSKQWRFRKDMKLRSSSEGQDTFVFLNPSLSVPSKQLSLKDVKGKNVTKCKNKEGEHKTAFSAYEKHYGKRRTRKESDKRRSFLPYKQVLVGFFANANRFSRNLHPF